jgi:hypothetical protein
MAYRVQVALQEIRSSGRRMKQFASEADRLGPDPEREADAADRANRGFMTGEACKALADDFKEDMQELREHWEDTADALDGVAKDWDDADSGVGTDFDGIGSDLRDVKIPRT